MKTKFTPNISRIVIVLVALILIIKLNHVVQANFYSPSFPTRTPIPDNPTDPPPQPTNPPVPTTQPTNPPGPTNTLIPGITNTPPPGATNTPPTFVTNTPLPGNTVAPPTVVPPTTPCGVPVVRAFSGINVRSGPDAGNEIVHIMSYLETLPITGRAGLARWWEVSLPNNSNGWVSNSVITVYGNVNNVPITESTTEDGNGAWKPATPGCPASATSTPVSSSTTTEATAETETSSSPTVTTTETTDSTSTLAPTSENAATEMPATNTQEPDLATSSPEIIVAAATNQQPIKTRDAGNNEAESSIKSTTQPTSIPVPPLEGEADGGSLPWPLIGGVGLLAGGGILLFTRRKEKSEES